MAPSKTNSRVGWFRRIGGAIGAVVAAALVLPVPVLAAGGSVSFSGSWSAGYYITGGGVNPTPPTPTYSDSLVSNGSNGQKDTLSVSMGTYDQNAPQTTAPKQAFETITLNRTIVWTPGSSGLLNVNWALDDFLNAEAQGIDQATLLTTGGTVVTNLLNPQTYVGTNGAINGTHAAPTEVKKQVAASLSKSQLAAGTYILQVTVRFQTLANNKYGGAWNSKSTSHLFAFFAS